MPAVAIKGLTAFALFGATIAIVPGGPRDPRTELVPLYPGALHGEITIVSTGIATISTDDAAPFSVFHVRESFVNRADNVWTVDLAATAVTFGEGAPVHPMLINSDVGTLPLAIIGRGSHRVADLYFAVPAKVGVEAELGPIALSYRLSTADRRYEGKLALVAAPRTPTAIEHSITLGWTPTWWADPQHAWPVFAHKSGILVPRPPKRVTVLRAGVAWLVEQTLASASSEEEWPRTDECNDW